MSTSTLSSILDQTLSTPTAFNLQPYHVLLVSTPAQKELLKPAMLGGNTGRVCDSNLTAIFLSDLEPSKRIPRILDLETASKSRTPDYLVHLPLSASFFTGEGGHLSNLLKAGALSTLSPSKPVPHPGTVEGWANKNTGMAAMTYILACESAGYATCAMEGFDAERVKIAFNIPDRYAIPMMIATGLSDDGEADKVKSTPRLEKEETVFFGGFGQTGALEVMYDDKQT